MKKDGIKSWMLYVLLVILVVLLLLPPGFRIFIKNDVKVEIKKDDVAILTCSKEGEIVSTSYLNNKAYSIYYSVKENYLSESELSNDNDNQEEKQNESIVENKMVIDFRPFGKPSYDEVNNTTEFNINFDNEEIYNVLFDYTQNIDDQSNFYQNNGFTCTKSVIEN